MSAILFLWPHTELVWTTWH